MSIDPTENIRREMVNEINNNPIERKALESKHGQVWDTNQLQEDFEVHSFLAPFVMATNKKTDETGLLSFQNRPRFYYDWIVDKY